ncbi:MAG: GNAT family N-acetyltransferase [Paenibacillus dendritiformis]|uniref:GNAT family N-acetyltransferase n=1 Tax=Paenibacillus dendritiformis TaxID=130049 RepID=UPI00143DD118|nr:GNAT family N-acetyltransferase [Paenibacillus dendritiformis]MDU5141377.1 GNAT family N-acetyltransferase [Paenibacillus dendritiformis]NKI21074.1 GNAT family N-acetyltransferase [Paenibacillus dendritiformis]NRF97537.1 GNAT family N-acetyltransferase [Paenibacillus dendritiformis]GIO72250.1 putative N-acetyltransferase YfmK [Paenibacillus dendritiformis]
MNMLKRLEPLGRNHLPLLAAWFEDAEVQERMDGMLPLEDWFDYASANDMYYMWLAYQEEQPVGLIFIELDGEAGYIGLITDPSLRNQGYGKAMVRELMNHPELQSVHTWVACIEADNKPCLACFKSLGYVTDEEEPDEDGFYNLVYERS